jgi:acetylornithine deacetylase/succinyl-diaminopimelate desuccinylase-like protein
MRHVCRKTLLSPPLGPRGNSLPALRGGQKPENEGRFVNGLRRMPRLLLHVIAWLPFATLPLAAQVAPPPTNSLPASQSPLDMTSLTGDAKIWLQDLIKINTTNPPGNEQAATKYILAILQKEGIAAEELPVAPGRTSVVARLRSSAVADPARALLLVAHMDVVGVDRAKWTVDPFAATIKDGYLYGRGAIDNKAMLVTNLVTFIALKRANARLNRDVIFLATDDEEQGGDASIKILIAKYWDKIAAGFALNEGGNVVLENGKVQYVAVQASEKVAVNVTVVARGTSGHASMPTKDNPIVHLSAAVEKIGGYVAPVHFTTIVRRYFEGLAPLEDGEISKWMRSLDTADRGEHAQRVISDTNPQWNSMLRDTISPTMLVAGVRANVIPSEARATLNVRLLPGDTIDALLSELNKLVNDPLVRLDVQPDAGLAAPPSSLENDFYAAITKVAAQEFGGAPVLPYQSPWATDSAQLRLHNVQAYGLWPFPLTPDDLKRMHGDDERIPLTSFAKGIDVESHIVAEFAVTK